MPFSPCGHTLRTPDHISRRRLASACPGAGHSRRPFLARRVPDPLFSPGSATWPDGSGSSLLPSGGAPGVLPFAGLLPPAGGRAGYQSRGSACDIAALRCAPASHALRASLLVRAHVPVDRVIPSAPRLIFVGEAPSSDDTPGTFDSIRLLGFVPAGGPFRRLRMTSSSARRRSFLPWALPLSGLSVTPRIRRFRRSWLCVLAGGHDPACRIISLRPTDLPPAYPLVGVTASFPVARVRRRHSVVEALALPAGAASSRRNSPALQRVVGLMPGRSDEPRDPSDRLPV